MKIAAFYPGAFFCEIPRIEPDGLVFVCARSSTGQLFNMSVTNDEELHQLARLAGIDASSELLDTLIDLVRIVSPQGVVAFLRAAKDARLRAAVGSAGARS